MERRKFWLACVFLALAACGKSDPLADARAACANGEAEARVAACTTMLESGALDEAERAAVLANRGAARVGDVTASLRDYEAALASDAGNMQAVMGRAAILIESGQGEAAEHLARRLEVSGEYQDTAHYLLGRIAAQRGDPDAALTAFDAAIAANARHADAYSSRGAILQAREDYAAAIADYDRAIAINSRQAPALAGRCWSRTLQDEPDMARARADADAAAASDPSNAQGQLCRGLHQLRAGEWGGARESYDAVLELAPGNPTALFGRGIARRRGGDDGGTEDMNQARDFSRNIDKEFDQLGVRTY